MIDPALVNDSWTSLVNYSRPRATRGWSHRWLPKAICHTTAVCCRQRRPQLSLIYLNRSGSVFVIIIIKIFITRKTWRVIKCVFSLFLRLSTVSHVFTELGSLFHKRGAAEANARSPHDRFDLGTTRERSLEDRRPERDGLWMLMRESDVFR